MCNLFDLAVEEAKAKVSEWNDTKKKLQQSLNETFKDKEFLTVMDCYKTPCTTSGTNYKGRKCRLMFNVDQYGVTCHPTFQNLRTKEYDQHIDYFYGPEKFELVEG